MAKFGDYSGDFGVLFGDWEKRFKIWSLPDYPRELTALGRYWSVSIPLNCSVWRCLVEAACRIAMDTSFLLLELCHLQQPCRHQHLSSSIGENDFHSENYYLYQFSLTSISK